MIGFRDFTEGLKRKYIEIGVDERSQDDLMGYCLDYDLDLTMKWSQDETQKATEFDFHTTIFYSSSVHNFVPEYRFDTIADVRLTGFDIFGENKNILVAKIESPTIRMIRKHYEALGFEDKWPEYKPHITLTYNYRGENLPPQDDFPNVVFDKFRIKDIE